MPSIDAAKLPLPVLRALKAGRSVALTESGRTIATVRAEHRRPTFDPKRELRAIRAADRDDNWFEFASFPAG